MRLAVTETCRRDITVLSALMLLVGTQPLRAQHPPLTPLPLGNPPQADTRTKAPGGEGRGLIISSSRIKKFQVIFQPDTRVDDEM